jgi:hypothetical protein
LQSAQRARRNDDQSINQSCMTPAAAAPGLSLLVLLLLFDPSARALPPVVRAVCVHSPGVLARRVVIISALPLMRMCLFMEKRLSCHFHVAQQPLADAEQGMRGDGRFSPDLHQSWIRKKVVNFLHVEIIWIEIINAMTRTCL